MFVELEIITENKSLCFYVVKEVINTMYLYDNFLGLLTLLGTLDSVLIHKAYHSILTSGASTQLVFGFEVILLCVCYALL